MNNVDLVIFDIDGTILNTRPAIVYTFEKVCAFHNIKLPSDSELFSKTLEEFFEEASPSNFGKIVAEYRAEYLVQSRSKTSLYDGVKELLYDLKADGIDLATFSSKSTLISEQELSQVKLDDVFQISLGPDNHRETKPDPSAILRIMNFFRASRENTLYVGDTVTDLKTARNANVTFCHAEWGYGNDLDLETNDLFAHDLSELRDIIFSRTFP